MRFACDTGGTFTDLIVEEDDGTLQMFKAATVPSDPVQGVLDALAKAAEAAGESLADYLARGSMLIHGTTHAINAIVTGRTARTAFLTTKGHRDVLVFREGGRIEPFNFTVPYPEPYVPRSLTFEVPERIDYAGNVVEALDEAAVRAIAETLRDLEIEAVGICLLWSVANAAHEERVAEILGELLPGVPVTLSHRLNPAIREYRRASATCIDASLKPLMGKYLNGLEGRLRDAGFEGQVMVLTSQGGMMAAETLAGSPIHAINSGPSMAPLAGRFYTEQDGGETADAIIADTGGTTYDVSLVRGGAIPVSREMWIGQAFRGHMTGFPSVDVKSVGAGGGSIAWVDAGGMLHVGPQSAGADPGPACYARGGTAATVTDASVVLGFIDPDYFLGGTMKLDVTAAEAAVDAIAARLDMTREEAAWSIIELATENMVQAIGDITVSQGIDPSCAALVGGGGAAGLNSVFIARRLNCPRLIIPETGAGLSAAGALMSDLMSEYRAMFYTTSAAFDVDGANGVLTDLEAQCRGFADAVADDPSKVRIEFAVEARYPAQVWEIDIPLGATRFETAADVERLVEAFHDTHETIFAVRDDRAGIEIVGWRATVRCVLRADRSAGRLRHSVNGGFEEGERPVYFRSTGRVTTPVRHIDGLREDETLSGPAIVESPFTTVVVDPGSTARRTASGSLVVEFAG